MFISKRGSPPYARRTSAAAPAGPVASPGAPAGFGAAAAGLSSPSEVSDMDSDGALQSPAAPGRPIPTPGRPAPPQGLQAQRQFAATTEPSIGAPPSQTLSNAPPSATPAVATDLARPSRPSSNVGQTVTAPAATARAGAVASEMPSSAVPSTCSAQNSQPASSRTSAAPSASVSPEPSERPTLMKDGPVPKPAHGTAAALPPSPEEGVECTVVTTPSGAQAPASYFDCDIADLATMVAAMLDEIVQINDRLPLNPDKLTRFHSRAAPGISVRDYIFRIVKFCSIDKAVLIALLYYIDLLTQSFPNFIVTTLTVHRFIITSVAVGAKGLCDSFCTNALYAKVGGISKLELNLLEVEFLTRVDYRIVPRADVLSRLYEHVVRSHGLPKFRDLPGGGFELTGARTPDTQPPSRNSLASSPRGRAQSTPPNGFVPTGPMYSAESARHRSVGPESRGSSPSGRRFRSVGPESRIGGSTSASGDVAMGDVAGPAPVHRSGLRETVRNVRRFLTVQPRQKRTSDAEPPDELLASPKRPKS